MFEALTTGQKHQTVSKLCIFLHCTTNSPQTQVIICGVPALLLSFFFLHLFTSCIITSSKCFLFLFFVFFSFVFSDYPSLIPFLFIRPSVLSLFRSFVCCFLFLPMMMMLLLLSSVVHTLPSTHIPKRYYVIKSYTTGISNCFANSIQRQKFPRYFPLLRF